MEKEIAEGRQPTPNTNPNKGRVVIGSADIIKDRLNEYVCPDCRLIIRARGTPTEIFCTKCQKDIIINPEPKAGITIPQAQQVQTLIDPNEDSDNEPAVASIVYDPNAGVSHTKHGQPMQLKDGALALSKKGTLRFTSYYDSSA